MENSTAHWCKSVIEEVVQPTLYSSQNTATTATPAGFVGQHINPQYMQLYQDFYKQQAAAMSGQSYVPTIVSSIQTQVEPPSYKAILTQNKQQPQLSSTPINTSPWNTFNSSFQQQQYIPPAPTPVAAPSNAIDPRTQKKPNPSRFTSISSATHIQNIATAPNASAPSTGGHSQGVKQPNSMNEFVKRAFAACASDTDRSVITAELQKLIQKVSADGRVNIHRWDLEPTPIPPSVKAATTAALTAKTQAAAAEESKKRKSRWGGAEMHPLPPSPSPASSISFVYTSSSSEPAKKKSALSGGEAAPTREEMQMREKRANRFQDDHKLMTQRDSVPVLNVTSAAGGKKNGKNAKKQRGVSIGGSASSGSGVEGGGEAFDMESLKIVGTCQKLEKDYLRLTSAPHHSVVRPESVLRKTVTLLKKKWAAEEVDYVYMCSQLKSLRQDLTVQHIASDFSVHVYETHARVALESDDMNEYNQCQTQLKQLYAAGHKGCEMEFVAYLILYYVYLLGNKKYQNGSSDLAFLLASLKPEAYSNAAVSHALKVRRAVQLDNYHQFFLLYKTTPNMGNYLLDLMVDNFRLQALQKVVRAYKPSVPLDFAMRALGFEDAPDEGLELLRKAGCVVAEGPEGTEINTKDSVVDMAAFLTQEKLLL